MSETIDIGPLTARAESAPRIWRDQFADLGDASRDELVRAIAVLASALDIAAHTNAEIIKLGKLLEQTLLDRRDQIQRIANSFEKVMRERDSVDLVVLAQRRKEVCEVALRGLQDWVAAGRIESIDWPEPYTEPKNGQ